MVRLKGKERFRAGNWIDKFQFQYGTIKSKLTRKAGRKLKVISIPVWYD